MERPFKYHGVREIHSNATNLDEAAEEIRNMGYTVIDGELSDEELQTIRDKSEAIYARQVQECGGEENLHRINDAWIARCLVGYDDYFIRLAAHDKLTRLVTRLLGDYYILMAQNAIINRADREHYQITWHRDLNYQHFVCSRPLAISALYCIDEFTELTGATSVLPASHKVEAFPSRAYVEKHERIVEARAGSIIVFDAMLFHHGNYNRSGRTRMAVNHIFALPLIKQQIDLPSTLGDRFKDDPWLRRLLGYDSAPAASPHLWRKRRIDMLKPPSEAA
jgi:ectoine hydroxylase-related dioxygenase (phytanoyl-CoA dioxygenase family)